MRAPGRAPHSRGSQGGPRALPLKPRWTRRRPQPLRSSRGAQNATRLSSRGAQRATRRSRPSFRGAGILTAVIARPEGPWRSRPSPPWRGHSCPRLRRPSLPRSSFRLVRNPNHRPITTVPRPASGRPRYSKAITPRSGQCEHRPHLLAGSTPATPRSTRGMARSTGIHPSRRAMQASLNPIRPRSRAAQARSRGPRSRSKGVLMRSRGVHGRSSGTKTFDNRIHPSVRGRASKTVGIHKADDFRNTLMAPFQGPAIRLCSPSWWSNQFHAPHT